MTYTIQEIATILQLPIVDLNPTVITQLLTDSRRLTDSKGTLFFALQTRSNDAHRFVEELYREGVRNFVVTKVFPEWNNFTDANFLKVKNSLTALQKVAASHRARHTLPIIGITGSNGKTVVKEWLYQLLEKDYNITRSPRSYNSQIGVPLSVMQLDEKSELGVFEAGISMPNEMEHLEPIIRPTIGVLTNIGEAHQENFTSLQQKVMEKLELFVNCDVFIFDEDNKLVSECVDLMVLSQKSFSWSRVNRDAPLYIASIEKGEKKTLIKYSFLNLDHSFYIPFTDEASIENAINSLAVSLYLHVPPQEISERMMQLESVAMRLELRKGKQECLIINDSYNSDINSIRIALDFLEQRCLERSLTKTVILSDILQSGLSARSLYGKVAELIEKAGIQKLIGIGPEISANADLFLLQDKMFFTSTQDFITSAVWRSFNSELILLKGARRFHFEQINSLIEERIHETQLEVDLDAVVHNFNFYKSKLNPHTKLVCMVKANAYGAGAVEIAKTLQYHRCDYLAVAVAEEGILLRKEGITLPILVLNPEINGFEELLTYNLEPEVYNFRILKAYIKEAERRGITEYPIHLKIDSGMHRLGFLPSQIAELQQYITNQKGLKVLSVFSHLSASESWIFDDFTQKQIDTFRQSAKDIEAVLQYPIWKHILNSAGIERFSSEEWDLTRLGIGLYGISASGILGLKNVCTLKTTILQIKEIPAYETIGYGRKERLERNARIATIRFGYADGLNRLFGNRKGSVLINGQLAPIVGNVCMDLCMVDVTDISVEEGDTVIIFGEGLSVIKQAESIGTIPYEILTSVSPRVKRIYLKE